MKKVIYLVIVEDKFKPYIDTTTRYKVEAEARVKEINEQAGATIAYVDKQELSL